MAVINVLPVVFGSSYIWWPSQDVRGHNGTDGLIAVNRYAWGVFVIASAVAVLAVALTGLRARRRWAWRAAWYDVVFFVAVALIEPDYLFPVVFAAIVAAALAFSHRWYDASDRPPAETGST